MSTPEERRNALDGFAIEHALNEFTPMAYRAEYLQAQQGWHDVPDSWGDALKVGDKVAFQSRDGIIYTDTIQAMTYTSAEPAIWPTLSRWQSFLRRMTPSRWRKPLEPIRAATLPTVAIKTGDG